MTTVQNAHVQLKLLSIATVGKLLEVSPSTVRRLIKSGALKARKIGGQVRIALVDLNAFIQQSNLINGSLGTFDVE